MTNSDLASRYNNAAFGWAPAMARLGYASAYTDFIKWALPTRDCKATVCDMGTGSGALAEAYLGTHGAPEHLSIVDSSPEMLSLAASTIGKHTVHFSCHNTSLAKFHALNSFDIVLSAHVIEHCTNPKQALAKLWQLTKPSGHLLLIVSRPHWCQWLIWLRWRHRWYSQAAISRFANEMGLPSPRVFEFSSGPPQRTSRGYVFQNQPK